MKTTTNQTTNRSSKWVIMSDGGLFYSESGKWTTGVRIRKFASREEAVAALPIAQLSATAPVVRFIG